MSQSIRVGPVENRPHLSILRECADREIILNLELTCYFVERAEASNLSCVSLYEALGIIFIRSDGEDEQCDPF